MDSLEIITSQWSEISFALWGLWSALGFGVIAAFSFFFGHAIIPSAASTRTISNKFSFLRPIPYITMDFFPRFWQ